MCVCVCARTHTHIYTHTHIHKDIHACMHTLQKRVFCELKLFARNDLDEVKNGIIVETMSNKRNPGTK